MNIALIRPPKISGSFEKILIQEPINLAYLGAFLKSNGHNAKIFDFEAERLSESSLREKLKNNKIEIAGITAMTPTINNAHDIALKIKRINKKIPVVAGGPHVSAVPEESLHEFPAFDYIIIGEGEQALLSLCTSLINKKLPSDIPGIVFRKEKKIIINQPGTYLDNLDLLPFPDRALLNEKYYRHSYAAGINNGRIKSTVMFTSRGCRQKCTFCAVKTTSGVKVRFRSAENVIEELKECKERFGYQHITFEDTNLTLNRSRFIEIAQGLKKLGLTWDCQTKVSLVDRELITIMKDCGCLKIAYGVESGSEKILKLMKKDITLEQVKKAFELTRKAKIVSCAFFIIGSHPLETSQDIRLTERLIHEIKPDVFQLGIICPYPGTEIFQTMKKEGLINKIDWKKFNFMHANPPWRTRSLSSDELIKFQKRIYTRYIFSPYFLRTIIKKMFNPKELKSMLTLGFYMIKYLAFEKRN